VRPRAFWTFEESGVESLRLARNHAGLAFGGRDDGRRSFAKSLEMCHTPPQKDGPELRQIDPRRDLC